MWQKAIVERRKCGFVRCASTTPSHNAQLSDVLRRFGLKPDADALHIVKRIQAAKILAHLLWKDLAYRAEIMPFEEASALAGMFIEGHSESGTKFYVNADWSRSSCGWSGLTDATLDGGVMAVSARVASCVWVEDED